jgi:copper chaperone CopZ
MSKIAGLLLVGLLVALPARDAALADPADARQSSEKVYVLGIEGMTCEKSCPQAVKKSIESLPGVRKVEVSFADKQAVVHTDGNVDLSAHQIDLSFHNQGYFVSSLRIADGK